MIQTRNVPNFIGAILLLLFAKPAMPGTAIGVALIAMGQAIRIWSAGHLVKNDVLTVTGPYAYVKNPLYVGSILITTGYCIFADNIYILAAATLMFCFHYIPYKKVVEGARLRKIYGAEYEDYDRNVPEYIPQLRRYSDKKATWSFRRFIENSEEGVLLTNLTYAALVYSRPYWRWPW
jgi:protein-S-isoprenylcysteine O-methyltransferase Ste14